MSKSSRSGAPPSDDWGTPEDVCDMLYEFWGGPPDFDPCTGPTAFFRAKEMWSVGGLQRTWFGMSQVLRRPRRTGFCNMPYSRLLPWNRKCAEEATSPHFYRDECELVALPPASTSADWFKRYASKADAFCFTKRLNFIGHPGGERNGNARFHSVLLYFGADWPRFKKTFAPITTLFARSA